MGWSNSNVKLVTRQKVNKVNKKISVTGSTYMYVDGLV